MDLDVKITLLSLDGLTPRYFVEEALSQGEKGQLRLAADELRGLGKKKALPILLATLRQ